MRTINDFDFRTMNILEEGFLMKEADNEELTNFESFLLVNPKTDIVFPEFDELFYKRYDATLAHILHCYDTGWIKSERQVFYSSNECLTTIQFVNREDRIQCNVFQRSSNLKNIKEDVEFLNWFLDKYFTDRDKELNIFVSMPHVFKQRKTKVG